MRGDSISSRELASEREGGGERWAEVTAGVGLTLEKEMRREKEGKLGRFQEVVSIRPKLDKL
jgi:hypothetical protein